MPRVPRRAKEIGQEPPPPAQVPPGQFVTEKLPVLTYGPAPHIELASWRFRIFGLVEEEKTLSWQQLMALPTARVVADFHCVTQWSRLHNIWEGVPFREIMRLSKPLPEAHFVMVQCYGGYTTNLPLEALLQDDVLFAYRHDDADLSTEHGGPLRLVVPKLYGWKSAKWVNGLEFMEQNQPGFWEQRGYSMGADPWKEERFWPELT
ncbi:MAG: sulfite oxidase-like oxidoreductase [Chloroflexi bacterium]|nr:sulfite oxidase-like oxidoreductase [Chloroflexota bacterium]